MNLAAAEQYRCFSEKPAWVIILAAPCCCT